MFKKVLSVLVVVLSFFVAVSTVTPLMAQAPEKCKMLVSQPTPGSAHVDADLKDCGHDNDQMNVVITIIDANGQSQTQDPVPGTHAGWDYREANGQVCAVGYAYGETISAEKSCVVFGNGGNTKAGQPAATAQPVAATATPAATASGDTQAQSQGVQTYGPTDCPIGTTYVPVAYGSIMKIQTQSGQLNLRTEAGTQNPAKMLMKASTVILSLEETKCAFGDIWMLVAVGELKGWAAYQGKNQYFFLKADESSAVATATPSASNPTATVAATVVNLPYVGLTLAAIPMGESFVATTETVVIYSGPGNAFRQVAQATGGSAFLKLNELNGWYQVGWLTGNGWVSRQGIAILSNTGKPLPTPKPVATATAPVVPTTVATTVMESTPTPESLGPVSMVCGIAPQPRLILGAAGHNSPDQGKTNVRLTPRGEGIYQLSEGEKFMVLQGIVNYSWNGQDYSNVDATPQCHPSGTDGSLMWYLIQVTLDDGTKITGWSPEGTGKDGTAIYWLLPG